MDYPSSSSQGDTSRKRSDSATSGKSCSVSETEKRRQTSDALMHQINVNLSDEEIIQWSMNEQEVAQESDRIEQEKKQIQKVFFDELFQFKSCPEHIEDTRPQKQRESGKIILKNQIQKEIYFNFCVSMSSSSVHSLGNLSDGERIKRDQIAQREQQMLNNFHQEVFQIAQQFEFYPEHIQNMIPVVQQKWRKAVQSNKRYKWYWPDVQLQITLKFFKQIIYTLATIQKFVYLWADIMFLSGCTKRIDQTASQLGLHLMEEDSNSYSTHQTSFFNGEFSLTEFVEEVKDFEQIVVKKYEVKEMKNMPSISNANLQMQREPGWQDIYQDMSQIQGISWVNPKYEIKDIQKSKCVGIFQAVWKDKNGRVVQVGFATAFAISPHLIVTCAHSIFDNNTYRQCTEAYFISTEEGEKSRQEHIYPVNVKSFAEYTKIKRGERYGLEPLRQDIAVLALERPLESSYYLSLSKRPLMKGDKVEIWGFPSKHYEMVTPRLGTFFKRVDLEGQYCYSKGDSRGKYTMVHSCLTSEGHSGSPIVRLVQRNGRQFYDVVGMHTHRGIDANTNEGLEMTKEMRRNVWTFTKKICSKSSFKQWNFIKNNFNEVEEFKEIEQYRMEDEDDLSMSSKLQKDEKVNFQRSAMMDFSKEQQ